LLLLELAAGLYLSKLIEQAKHARHVTKTTLYSKCVIETTLYNKRDMKTILY